jgi:general secretion pathway protein F
MGNPVSDMPTYSYTAKSVQGEVIQGVLTADSHQAALHMLDERALYPLDIKEGVSAASGSLFGKKVKLSHLSTAYNQLADLLRAGVPVLRSLDLLCKQNAHPSLTAVMRVVRDDVAGGTSLADSMAKHPKVFASLHCSMVKAGERGGFLEDVLARVATFVDRQNQLRSKLVGAMIYPTVLLVACVGVVVLMMTIVVPKIRPLLESGNMQLPMLTRLIFNTSDIIQAYGLFIGAGIAGVAMAVTGYLKTKRGRYNKDVWKLKMPIMGNLFTMVAVCRFCRILGTLIASGVPILQALQTAKDSADNQVLADAVEAAAENVRKGEPLAGPLAKTNLFPMGILDIISVGEESNTLDKVLVEVADTNEARTSQLIDTSVRLLEPILIVFMAVIVGIVALGLLLPILGMAAQMKA